MSLIPNQTNINQDNYFFVEVNSKVINTSTITANTGTYNTLFTNNISSGNILVKNISTNSANISTIVSDYISTQQLNASTISSFTIVGYNNYLDYIQNILIATNFVNLDSNLVTASNGDLYINGVLVATPQSVGIDKWANYPAIAHINANFSTIKNVQAISTNNISSGTVFSGLGNINSLTANSITNTEFLGYNANILNNLTVPAISSVIVSTNLITANVFKGNYFIGDDIRVNSISTILISSFAVLSQLGIFEEVQSQLLDVSQIGFLNETHTNHLSSGSISSATGYFSTLNVDTINIKNLHFLSSFSTVNTFSVSTGQIYTSSIFGNIGLFNDLSCNNLTVTNNTTLNNLTANGTLNFNNNLGMNGDINFPTYNVVSVDYPTGLAQFLKDINNLRNLKVERIDVTGGATGNTVLPPYRNDSIVNIGINTLSPGVVTINGLNPDPLDPDIALTVYGDSQFNQDVIINGLTDMNGIANVAGLFTAEGDATVVGLFTADGGADVNGILNTTGLTSALGGLSVVGLANFLGAITAQSGIGIVGALGLTGGNVTFGSPINMGNSFTNYYGTVLSNGLTVYGNTTFNGSVNLQGQQNVSTLSTFQVTTNSIKMLETGNNLTRLDFYNSNDYNTPQNSIFQFQSNLLIDSANSIYSAGLGEYHIFGNSNILINSSNEIVLSNIGANNNIILSAKDVDIPTQLRVSSISTLQLLGNQIGLETKYINNDTRNAGITFFNSNSQAVGAIAEVADSNLYTVSLYNMVTEVAGDYTVTSSNRAGIQSDWELGLNSLSTIYINTSEAVIITNSGSNALGIQCPTVIDNRLQVNSNIQSESVSSIYISSLQIETDTLFTNTLNALTISSGSISNSHFNTQSISSLRISTGSLFGGVVSSQQLLTSSINANRIGVDRITGFNNGTNTFTNNLFPTNAGAQIGFFGSAGTNSGGFYNNISVRSTLTQVIAPDIVGIYSNIVRIQGNTLAQNLIVSSISASTIQSRSNISTNEVRTQFLRGAGQFGNFVYTTTLLPDGVVNIGNAPVNTFQQGWFNTVYTSNIQANTASGLSINSTVSILGTLSTQNITVSTINRKLYPYTSSLNTVVSTYTIDGTTANIPTVLFSNITFPHIGNYTVSAKMTASKSSGGGGQDAHSFISLSRGLYASTFSEQDGFSAVPYINETNTSSFTTLNTDVYISSMNTNTRFLTFTDYSANAYIMNLAVDRLRMRYLPIQGFSTE